MKIIIKNRMQNKKNKRQKSNDFQNPCRLLEAQKILCLFLLITPPRDTIFFFFKLNPNKGYESLCEPCGQILAAP